MFSLLVFVFWTCHLFACPETVFITSWQTKLTNLPASVSEGGLQITVLHHVFTWARRNENNRKYLRIQVLILSLQSDQRKPSSTDSDADGREHHGFEVVWSALLHWQLSKQICFFCSENLSLLLASLWAAFKEQTILSGNFPPTAENYILYQQESMAFAND